MPMPAVFFFCTLKQQPHALPLLAAAAAPHSAAPGSLASQESAAGGLQQPRPETTASQLFCLIRECHTRQVKQPLHSAEKQHTLRPPASFVKSHWGSPVLLAAGAGVALLGHTLSCEGFICCPCLPTLAQPCLLTTT